MNKILAVKIFIANSRVILLNLEGEYLLFSKIVSIGKSNNFYEKLGLLYYNCIFLNVLNKHV